MIICCFKHLLLFIPVVPQMCQGAQGIAANSPGVLWNILKLQGNHDDLSICETPHKVLIWGSSQLQLHAACCSTVTSFGKLEPQWSCQKKKQKQVPLESQYGSRNEGGGIQSKNSRRAQHNIILSMRFPRQKYWSGLSFPSAGSLPD